MRTDVVCVTVLAVTVLLPAPCYSSCEIDSTLSRCAIFRVYCGAWECMSMHHCVLYSDVHSDVHPWYSDVLCVLYIPGGMEASNTR